MAATQAATFNHCIQCDHENSIEKSFDKKVHNNFSRVCRYENRIPKTIVFVKWAERSMEMGHFHRYGLCCAECPARRCIYMKTDYSSNHRSTFTTHRFGANSPSISV